MGIIDRIKKIIKNIKSATNQDEVISDFHKFDLSQRMAFELEMLKHYHNQIRIVGDPKYKLLEVLNISGINLLDTNILSSYAVIEDWSTKFCKTISDIYEYNIFDDYLGINKEGIWDILGVCRHVMLYIHFKKDGKSGFINLHMNPWGRRGENMSLHVRLSIIKRMEDEPCASFDKQLLVFDLKDPKEILDSIESYRRQATEKIKSGHKLTGLEYNSLFETMSIGGLKYYAEMRMKECRWGDAASDLLNIYNLIKKELLENKLNKKEIKDFFAVCYQLGLCYYNRESYTKAALYLDLASIDESKTEYSKALEKCHKKLNDLYIRENEYQEKKNHFLLGTIMGSCLHILPSELSNLIWIDNETMETGKIEKQPAIWTCDIKSLIAERNSVSIYLSYRASYAIIDDEYLDPTKNYTIKQPKDEQSKVNENFLRQTAQACVDKSICQKDGVIIITLENEGKVSVMSFMIPAFRDFDNNNNQLPLCMTIRFANDGILSDDDFEKMREKATDKLARGEKISELEYDTLGELKQAHLLFVKGKIAFQDKLFGDAIFFLTHVYRMIAPLWKTNDLDKFDRYSFGETCYMLGYIFNEFNQYENALYYLSIISETVNTTWTQEYINSLANSMDIRAYGFIKHEYEKLTQTDFYKDVPEKQRKSYSSFLKRRMGYILIDQERISEAKDHFTKLLDEPECCKFAQEELEYIARKYPEA